MRVCVCVCLCVGVEGGGGCPVEQVILVLKSWKRRMKDILCTFCERVGVYIINIMSFL